MTDEDVFYRTLDAFFKDANLQKARALAALADVSTEFEQLVFSSEGHPYRQDIYLRGSFLEAIVKKYGENSLEAKVEDAKEISFFEKAQPYLKGCYDLGKAIGYGIYTGIKTVVKTAILPFLPGRIQRWIEPGAAKPGMRRAFNNFASVFLDVAAVAYASYPHLGLAIPISVSLLIFEGFGRDMLSETAGSNGDGPFSDEGTLGPLVSEIVFYSSVYPLYRLGKAIEKDVKGDS